MKILGGFDTRVLMRNVIVDNTSVRLECTTALIHYINCIVTYTVTIASFQWYEEYCNSYKGDCNDIKEEMVECVACSQSSKTLCSCLATGGQVTRIAFSVQENVNTSVVNAAYLSKSRLFIRFSIFKYF